MSGCPSRFLTTRAENSDLTGFVFVVPCQPKSGGKALEMPQLTIQRAEETLRQAVQKLDKRAQLLAVNENKDEDGYRVTLVKDGRTGSAAIKKDVIEAFLSGEAKGNELRKALGKAVSRLSIKYPR